jgi:hypothetical protein
MWSAYLFQVVSGRIGPRLTYNDLSWEIDLNDTETIKVQVQKSALPKVDTPLWFEPLWAGIVLFWNSTPIVGGPILSRSNETEKTITFDCKGIRAMLARRLVIKEAGTPELASWDDLAKSEVALEGMSLGTVAKEVVKRAMKKPNGSLPIAFPIADESVSAIPPNLPACIHEDGSGQGDCYWDGDVQGNKTGLSYAFINGQQIFDDGNNERHFKGFNLQNINADQVLTKLSNVSRGPDIMFKPRVPRDNQVIFDMWHGTDRDPRIYQSDMKIWDTTAEKTEVSDISIINTGVYMTHRVFSLGAGQDEGQLITVSSNLNSLSLDYPLVETVVQTSDSENAAVVRAHGASSLLTNSKALIEIQMTVRGDGINPFGTFWPGDVCEVILKGWLALPDGKYRMRILNMTGNSSANTRLSLQLD